MKKGLKAGKNPRRERIHKGTYGSHNNKKKKFIKNQHSPPNCRMK